MIWRAWQDRKHWLKYLKQFACFGIVAFPLGLWYSVYCYIRYRMPFGYVVTFEESEVHFIGFHDKWSRLFDFDRAFENLAVRADHVNDFADYNIPVSLVKFAVFGDGRYYQATTLTNVLGTGLFWATGVLFLLMGILAVAWCFFRDGRSWQKVFLLTTAAVSLYAYLKFCFRYPHVSSMSVRYVMCAVYTGCLALAAAVSCMQERLDGKSVIAGNIFRRITIGISVLYGTAAVVLNMGMETVLQ